MERVFSHPCTLRPIHRHDISDKHVMASGIFHSTALNVYRAFFDHRHVTTLPSPASVSMLSTYLSRPEHTPSVIGRPRHGLGRQIDHELDLSDHMKWRSAERLIDSIGGFVQMVPAHATVKYSISFPVGRCHKGPPEPDRSIFPVVLNCRFSICRSRLYSTLLLQCHHDLRCKLFLF